LVLPFEHCSADPDQESLADGIRDQVSTLLARIPGLRVTARASAFYFKGRNGRKCRGPITRDSIIGGWPLTTTPVACIRRGRC
jgi:hypothetical protein